MNKTKKYTSLIVEILLIFSIILAVLSIFLRGVVLNKNTYLSILDKNGTYEQVKESIYDKMDKALGTKKLDNDIKESIITEDDIKKEADSAITGFIQYLKTGENNIAPIDTDVYKQRVADVLNTIVKDMIKPSKNDLSFNNVQTTNMAFTKNELQDENIGSIESGLTVGNVEPNDKGLQFENMVTTENRSHFDNNASTNEPGFNNMVIVNDKSQSGQDSVHVEKLMTSSEAQSKIQSILKQKGLTEEQARQKMAEKGITNEQALKMLESYGISIDDEPQTSGSGAASNSGTSNNSQNQTTGKSSNSDNQGTGISGDNQNQTSGMSGGRQDQTSGNQSQSSGTSNNNENQSSMSNVLSGQDADSLNTNGKNDGTSSISKLKEEIISAIITNDGKSIEEKLNNIEGKLTKEAGIKIDNEIQKINLSKLMESSKLQKLAKVISIFSKMFWLFMILPIILILILININDRKFYPSLRWVGSGFILAGLCISAIFFSGYLLKIYENINININVNTVYLKDIMSVTIKQFLINLSTAGIITSAIGGVLLIPIIKRKFKI